MAILKSIREDLGFLPRDILAVTGWPEARLAHIEAVDDLDDEEERVLNDLYGVDVAEAVCAPGTAPRVPPIAALLKGSAGTLSATSRFAMAEAVTVARTIRQLQGMLGVSTGWAQVDASESDNDYSHPRFGAPERLATRVRRALGLGAGPILSVQDQLLEPLGALVLWEKLPDAVDAFCMATPDTGAVIVANLHSEHVDNAFGRRVTWAHELCHILFDRPKMVRMKRLCAVAFGEHGADAPRDQEDEIERRARAFAVWLLGPRARVAEVWHANRRLPVEARVRSVMETFGLGYWAARSHLENTNQLSMSDYVSGVDCTPPVLWEQRDPGPRLNDRLLELGVSPLRAGVLLEHLLRAHAAGAVSESYVRGALRLDLLRWHEVRAELGFTANTWRTSSALLDYLA